MRQILVGALLSFSATAMAVPFNEFVSEAKRRCSPATEGEPVFLGSDFRFGTAQEEMLTLADALYESGKRLHGRAFYSPHHDEFQLKLTDGSVVNLPARIAFSIKRHIEEALRLEYVQVITFTDMGHSHFYVPSEAWEQRVGSIQGTRADTYASLFAEPGLKILYHTAEQLKMTAENGRLLDSEHLKWRYFTRNLLGDLQSRGQLEIHKHLERGFNTVQDVEGYRKYSAAFYLNATKNGCFAYEHKGQKFYFDLSLEPLPYPNAEF